MGMTHDSIPSCAKNEEERREFVNIKKVQAFNREKVVKASHPEWEISLIKSELMKKLVLITLAKVLHATKLHTITDSCNTRLTTCCGEVVIEWKLLGDTGVDVFLEDQTEETQIEIAKLLGYKEENINIKGA